MENTLDGYSYLKFEDSTFFPGDKLSGFLHIQIHTPLKFMEVFLCITAKESTGWFKSEEDKFQYSGNQVVLQQCLPFQNFNGTLDIGYYRFPFMIELSINAPPSFCYEHTATALRSYTIKARLQNAKKFKAYKTIFWVAGMPDDLGSIYPINTNLTIEFKQRLFRKDVSHVNLTLDKNTYFIDEMIKGTIRADQTHCKRKLIRISYGLMVTITVRDNNGHSTVVSCPFVFNTLNIKSKHSGHMSVYEFNIDLSAERGLWKKPSGSSILIECNYMVKVELIYHRFLKEDTRYITIPVAIVNTSKYLSSRESRAMPELMNN